MRTSMAASCFFVIGILSILAAPAIPAQTPQERPLKEAESRLRAIYERNEFRAKRFRADWLSDSSGYTILESAPDEDGHVLVRYDVPGGKRTVLDSPPKTNGLGKTSPDGRSVLSSDKGNLYVRDLQSNRKIPLTKNVADSPISNGRAVWSPDGKWVAYVQSDASHVRQRSVLVPGDPSYPEVKEVRFARVGGAIPMLRVGVVDAQGKETRWLPIAIPTEGYYLGQVSWAGNSDELLVEKLSRF